MCLSDESKASKIVYNNACDTTEFIALSLHKHTLTEITLKQLDHIPYRCIMSVLLSIAYERIW